MTCKSNNNNNNNNIISLMDITDESCYAVKSSNVINASVDFSDNPENLPEEWDSRFEIYTYFDNQKGKTITTHRIIDKEKNIEVTFDNNDIFKHEELIKKLEPEQIISLMYAVGYERARSELTAIA